MTQARLKTRASARIADLDTFATTWGEPTRQQNQEMDTALPNGSLDPAVPEAPRLFLRPVNPPVNSFP